MDWHLWLVYLLAVTGLSLTPGPNSLLALTHGALYGLKKTLFTILGGALGFMLIIALSMVGIGALLQTTASALVVLKLLGATYLVYLGIQVWRTPPMNVETEENTVQVGHGTRFKQGLFAAISNPKVLLFYGAFLPQFIVSDRPLLMQFVVMALTFGLVEFGVEVVLAKIAHRVRPWLRKMGKRFNQFCGGLFVGIGLALPFAK